MLFHTRAHSQNILDGLYIKEYEIQNLDSVSTVVKGKIIDKHSFVPLQNISVRYSASNGQNIGVVTDKSGAFSFDNLEADSVKAKIVCEDLKYKTITREFTISGNSRLREFNFNFEMERK